MKKNILIAGILSAISLAAISQASDNPWEYYWAGSSQKKSRSYSQSYNETTYGVGIKGLYAWASQDWEPDMGGVLADFYEHQYRKRNSSAFNHIWVHERKFMILVFRIQVEK